MSGALKPTLGTRAHSFPTPTALCPLAQYHSSTLNYLLQIAYEDFHRHFVAIPSRLGNFLILPEYHGLIDLGRGGWPRQLDSTGRGGLDAVLEILLRRWQFHLVDCAGDVG